MTKQSQHKSKKRQKELERMRKAKDKIAKRQGKKEKVADGDNEEKEATIPNE